jgi:hypothetical protein
MNDLAQPAGMGGRSQNMSGNGAEHGSDRYGLELNDFAREKSLAGLTGSFA